MASTSNPTRPRKAAATIVAAAVLGAGATWYAVHQGKHSAPPVATRSFWSLVTPEASEIDPPDTVSEVAHRSDAIVLAHVTGVTDGREDQACHEVAPVDGCTIPRTVFVQLTVDRTVHGAVQAGQVLNLEMFRPPKPLTLDSARDKMPPGEALFFLGKSSAVSALQTVWGVVSLTRGVVAQGSKGLYTALDPGEPNTAFLQSFRATTVDQAADAAAAALG
jgi:hypothetical protein